MDNFALGSNGGDAQLFVRIYSKAVEFKAESEKEGRPIFKEVPFIQIRVPGDPNTVVDTKLTESYKQRFPRHWQAFQAGQESAVEGTPLDQWPAISLSQCETFKALGFKTVEQVANSADTQLQRVGMGAFELRAKAKAYLAAASDSGAVQQIAAENERLKADMEALKRQLEQLGLAGQGEDRPRRGRQKEPEAA